MARIERILKAVEALPWVLMPQKAAVLGEILSAKADAGQIPTQSEIDAADARLRGESRNVGGTIAVLPMFGVMSRRMGMLGAMSGGLSVETFSKQFRELVDDDSVTAIVIDVDSPGGSVYGIEELSRQIFDARSKKRIIAIADQLMASGAYYAASSADELIVSPSGEVGSIGVYSIHFDWSKNLEEGGIKVTIIKAGERKAEGNPYETLSEEAAEHMQSMVDAYYSQFVEAVARNRGIDRATVEANFGQGLTFDAARALERGMVDRIATLDEVLAELTGGTVISESPIAGETEELGIAACVETIGSELDPNGMWAEVAENISRTLQIPRAELFADLGASETVIEGSQEPPEKKPDAALGHAAEEDEPAPTKPAPVATEDSMSEQDKALAAGATDEGVDLIQAERERAMTIRAKASEHGIAEESVEQWVASGADIETVNAAILEVLKVRQAESSTIVVGDDREAARPFRNFGEQLIAIMQAEQAGAVQDKRLLGIHAAATGSGGAVPSDGGFLLQPDFSGEILRRVYDLGEVLSRVRRRPIGPDADGLKINAVDETSRVTGSRYGGIQVYWADEGDTVTAKKPKFRQMELYLRKLMGIWYVTDELLKDSVALQAIGEDAFSEEIAFMVEDAIFRGTGSGQPRGFLNSNALVTVTAESGQAAATVVANNVFNMNARLWPRSRVNAAWFINTDVEPQLPAMTIGDQPVYLPPGGMRDTPFGILLGHPVIPVEYCETLGTLGDIVLADLDQYLLIDKGAAQSAWSIHVRFLNDEQTFRITYRVDGQPSWTSALTPYKGSNTLSPFVVLATRS